MAGVAYFFCFPSVLVVESFTHLTTPRRHTLRTVLKERDRLRLHQQIVHLLLSAVQYYMLWTSVFVETHCHTIEDKQQTRKKLDERKKKSSFYYIEERYDHLLNCIVLHCIALYTAVLVLDAFHSILSIVAKKGVFSSYNCVCNCHGLGNSADSDLHITGLLPFCTVL